MLLFYKAVDKSVLQAGFTIPVVHIQKLFDELGFAILRGQSKHIQIQIDNEVYSVSLASIGFDKNKYPNHQDLLQVRYGHNSDIAIKLKQTFQYTENLIKNNKDVYSAKWLSKLHETEKEFIAVYSTEKTDTLLVECITNEDFCEEIAELSSLRESLAESVLNGKDDSAEIRIKTKCCKIRHLSKVIGNDLKKLYNYRCQICGASFQEPYNSTLIHAHHIDYFVNSKNNNANNIMILCPNHHSIIHDQNPIFNRNIKSFIYPNGYVEPLLLNYHLD